MASPKTQPDKSLKIQIPGKKIENNPTDDTDTLAIQKTYEIGSVTRGESVLSEPEELNDTKVIEFTYDDKTVWIGDYTTIDEVFPGASAQVRSIESGQVGVVVIPTELTVGEQNRSGMLDKVLLTGVKIFTKRAVKPILETLAPRLELAQWDETPVDSEHPDVKKRSGLFGVDDQFKIVDKTVGHDGRYLLFLHGTASSTLGSFSELKGSFAWQFITQTFGANILCFQHETLSKSPLDNVLQLVRELPQRATLTVISHSRGGLVGDVLNRFFSGDSQHSGFSAQEKDFLRKQDRNNDVAQIEAIEQAILSKNITLEKFIRVACTASGTTLASRRLDIYFNVIFNIVGLATAQAVNPAYIAFKDLIAALIDTKNDASVLPGLEVQNPLSPFNQMLNNASPETVIQTPLVVISGDAEMSLRWKAITVALSNLFFWGNNDFVVDTRSMYNGAKRADGKVQYFFDESAEVSHFNYFKNPRTQNALLLALQTPAGTLIPTFTKLDVRAFTNEEIRSIDLSLPGGRVFQNQVSGSKPIVLLLPGIMGSTLSARDKLLWINFFGFVGGNLTNLLYSPDNNENIVADGLVGSSYRKLVEYLSRDYDVVTFPFDWRKDMATNASDLNLKVQELLKYKQPIKLIGHSMGGVLIRDFILGHDETWQILKALPSFRLLFLGAPLGGSFRIPYVLFGLDSLINTLDLIDLTHSQKDLLNVFSQFPGILSLLPLTTQKESDKYNFDFAQPQTWEIMRKAFGDEKWPVPSDDLLKDFGTYRDNVLSKTTAIDYGPVSYIAGQGRNNRQTISGYQYQTDPNGKPYNLEFLATKEGDESVTWESGIPAAMALQNAVYYSDVPHGELANDPKLFGAITDLLTTGATAQLTRTRPVVRGLEQEFKARAFFDFDLSPQGVEKTLMGLGTDKRITTIQIPISVSVSNGHLKYASYPIMVGHFANDGILFAEKAIDSYLDNELSRRHQLGLYPGDIGACETVIANTAKGLKGAIVVGLGRQGLGPLTEYSLTSTVEKGVSKYLVNMNHRAVNQSGANAIPMQGGISALLIGSGYGGLRIENAVRAILQGVQNANTRIRQIYESPRIVDTVEFVELYNDRALACMKAVSAIEKEESRSLNIFRTGNTIRKLTGWQERLPIDDTTDWWTRIMVVRSSSQDGVADNQQSELQFTISTDAARVEESSLQTINATLTDMLEDLSRKGNWSPELARAIFELMIPNDFKDQVKRQNNINWMLDTYTAGFPWELLQDSVTNALPLSVNAGMIRQLATKDFRININLVSENTAIVVGDPDLKNPALQLPAAFDEASAVTDFLSTQGFEVTKQLRGTAAQILRDLFSKNYKIVHLAGHGVFSNDPTQTGMVIGPASFLTPAYIKQMSSVPELVFVNCCYLGQTDGIAEAYTQSRFRLAANIGTQLIEIGVKAVVVAGWAVNDKAALDFAGRFYQYLFGGDTFGMAIKKARKAIFETYGAQNNTWGAYQCYGDPFYKLILNQLQKTKFTYDFVIPEEAEIELGNLLGKVESGKYDAEETTQKMDAIADALKRAGIGSGRIIERQALLYSGLNMYEQAVLKFDDLWKQEKATFSFSASEKYCNTQAKWHVFQVKTSKTAPASTPDRIAAAETAAISAINTVIEDLNGLMRFGKTIERINLLASAYKRLAQVSKGSHKHMAYKKSASSYHESYTTDGNRTKYYPLTNWLSIENALVLAGLRKWGEKPNNGHPDYCLPQRDEAIEWLDGMLKELNSTQDAEKDFWDWVAGATILLCKSMLDPAKVTYDSIQEQYNSAQFIIGTGGQWQGEVENLDFLEDALGMGAGKAKDQLAIIARLKAELTVLA